MKLRCTGQRITNGNLELLRCSDRASGLTRSYTVAEVVGYIELNGNTSVYSTGATAAAPPMYVSVVSDQGRKWVQSYADGRWTNNLQRLPAF